MLSQVGFIIVNISEFPEAFLSHLINTLSLLRAHSVILLNFYGYIKDFFVLVVFTGLRDEVKTLKIGLQNSMHQKEHVKKLLE